jgi:hypothetical protein
MKKIGADRQLRETSEEGNLVYISDLVREYYPDTKGSFTSALEKIAGQPMEQVAKWQFFGKLMVGEAILPEGRNLITNLLMQEIGNKSGYLPKTSMEVYSMESAIKSSEEGKERYQKSGIEEKIEILEQQAVEKRMDYKLQESLDRSAVCDLNSFLDVCEGKKKGFVVVQVATLGFRNFKDETKSMDVPIQITLLPCIIDQTTGNFKNGVSLRLNLDIRDEFADKLEAAYASAEKALKGERGAFDAFGYCGIDMNAYKNGVCMLGDEEKPFTKIPQAVKKMNSFFKHYPTSDYALISVFPAGLQAIERIYNSDITKAPCINFANVIKEYSYRQFKTDKENPLVADPSTLKSFGLDDVAENKGLTAPPGTLQKAVVINYLAKNIFDAEYSEAIKQKQSEIQPKKKGFNIFSMRQNMNKTPQKDYSLLYQYVLDSTEAPYEELEDMDASEILAAKDVSERAETAPIEVVIYDEMDGLNSETRDIAEVHQKIVKQTLDEAKKAPVLKGDDTPTADAPTGDSLLHKILDELQKQGEAIIRIEQKQDELSKKLDDLVKKRSIKKNEIKEEDKKNGTG